jgi:acetyltransferase-like isoleucine patch superfamily enzyme
MMPVAIKESGINEDVLLCSNVTVVMPSNLYGCTLGDNVFVGPFCEIQRGAVIGARTRVQSHCFICDLVEIGDDCFISHGVMFVNDTFQTGARAFGDTSKYKRTFIESGVTIGTGAVIMPVHIISGCVVGAGSVVTKDLVVKGIYAGNPAKLLRTL